MSAGNKKVFFWLCLFGSRQHQVEQNESLLRVILMIEGHMPSQELLKESVQHGPFCSF